MILLYFYIDEEQSKKFFIYLGFALINLAEVVK